jgi:hypothetical protein
MTRAADALLKAAFIIFFYLIASVIRLRLGF